MQNTIGLIVLIIISGISVLIAQNYAEDASCLFTQVIKFVFAFLCAIFAIYSILAVIFGIAWIIMWIGIMIREILQWTIESVFAPLRWIF